MKKNQNLYPVKSLNKIILKSIEKNIKFFYLFYNN